MEHRPTSTHLFAPHPVPPPVTTITQPNPNPNPQTAYGVLQCSAAFINGTLARLRAAPRFASLLPMLPCDLWAALRGRTLWLAGDSQSQRMYRTVRCFLREFLEPTPREAVWDAALARDVSVRRVSAARGVPGRLAVSAELRAQLRAPCQPGCALSCVQPATWAAPCTLPAGLRRGTCHHGLTAALLRRLHPRWGCPPPALQAWRDALVRDFQGGGVELPICTRFVGGARVCHARVNRGPHLQAYLGMLAPLGVGPADIWLFNVAMWCAGCGRGLSHSSAG